MAANPPYLYVARTIPSYRIGVLSELNSRLNDRLVVCSGDPPHSLKQLSNSRQDSFRTVHLTNYWIGGERLHIQNIRPVFKAYGRPAAIIAEESPRSLSLPVLLTLARLRRVRIGLWGHFSSNWRPFSLRNWQDRYRVRLARRADAVVCYTEGVASLLRPYVDNARVFVARNTLDTRALTELYEGLASEGKVAIRKRLGLPPDHPVLAFLGRLIPEKGTRTLVRIAERFQRDRPSTLIVIGDGPERATMEQAAREAGLDVRFLGALTAYDESSDWLFASDVMVLPGYVGLAVNHAFALGLPVVTHSSPGAMRYHSPEIEYLIDGRNGYIVPHEDVEAFCEAIEEVMRRQDEFARQALAFARENLTVERMVDGLAAAFRYLEDRRKS